MRGFVKRKRGAVSEDGTAAAVGTAGARFGKLNYPGQPLTLEKSELCTSRAAGMKLEPGDVRGVFPKQLFAGSELAILR